MQLPGEAIHLFSWFFPQCLKLLTDFLLWGKNSKEIVFCTKWNYKKKLLDLIYPWFNTFQLLLGIGLKGLHFWLRSIFCLQWNFHPSKESSLFSPPISQYSVELRCRCIVSCTLINSLRTEGAREPVGCIWFCHTENCTRGEMVEFIVCQKAEKPR